MTRQDNTVCILLNLSGLKDMHRDVARRRAVEVVAAEYPTRHRCRIADAVNHCILCTLGEHNAFGRFGNAFVNSHLDIAIDVGCYCRRGTRGLAAKTAAIDIAHGATCQAHSGLVGGAAFSVLAGSPCASDLPHVVGRIINFLGGGYGDIVIARLCVIACYRCYRLVISDT